MAYRRDALLACGGFDEGFPRAHGEDRELGLAMRARGPIAYVHEMSVEHPPRPIGALGLMRRGALVQSDWRLHLRFPETTPPRWSWRTGPVVRVARHWQRLVQDDIRRGHWKHACRVLGVGLGQVTVAALVTARSSWRVSTGRVGLGTGPAGTHVDRQVVS